MSQRLNLLIAVACGLIAFLGLILSWRRSRHNHVSFRHWGAEVLIDLAPELLSVALITLVVAILVAPAEESEQREELLRLMRSRDNFTALRALEELRTEGWLTAESLRGINLSGANLSNADLRGLDFEGANFASAILNGANLSATNLNGASFSLAQMSNANLSFFTDLRGAEFSGTTLENADFSRAYLSSAFIVGSDLTEANFANAYMVGMSLGADNLVKDTILPNGERTSDLINLAAFAFPDSLQQVWQPCLEVPYLQFYC
jgi:hypothetical protein